MTPNLSDALAESVQQGKAVKQDTYNLNGYLKLVQDNPTVAATAHERIYDMIRSAGSQPGAQPGETSWNFFADELFGMDVALTRVVSYFDSAAQGHETKRRILLLWGPPGGAKSSLVDELKRGLEVYSNTDAGAVYAIQGCPMHEEPLHMVPRGDLRKQVAAETGVMVERSLCPVCQWRLENEFEGDFMSMPIERISLSEDSRVGIGTFEPGDPKSQSMEQLTGGVDYSKITEYGSEAHPMALDWAGEFSKANRGIFEAVEFFKNPAEFRNAFLTAGQEKKFKPPKFGYIDLDCAIVAHTNEAEFRSFMSDQKNEALKSRLITIEVPYNVRIEDEVKIYRKLLTRHTRKFHISPHTLEAAAFVAVLSRLREHDGIDLVQKAKLYNGEETGEWKLSMVPELKRVADHEGMTGIGPREVINSLAEAAVNQERKDGVAYLTPILALMAVMSYVEHLQTPREERDKMRKFVIDARTEMDRDLKDEIRKAFIPAFDDRAQAILENYLTNVEAYLNDVTVRDPITHEEREPDEKLMRAVEEKVTPSVPSTSKEIFRQGVMVRIGMSMRGGNRALTYKTDSTLGRGIEEHLFDEMKDVIRITVSKHNPDPEQAKRLNAVLRVLTDDRGYSNESAKDIVEYVGELMNR